MNTLRLETSVAAPLLEVPAARPAPAPRPTPSRSSAEVGTAGPETAQLPSAASKPAAATDPFQVEHALPGVDPSDPDAQAALEQAAEELQGEFHAMGSHSLSIEFAEEEGRFIVKVLDRESGEVIRQLPPEDLLEANRQLSALRGLLFDDRS